MRHILALLAVLCLGVQSCEKNTRIPMRHRDAVQVTLRISAGDEPAGTRAVAETDENGTDYENYIDVSKLHILFFNKTTNVFMEEFKPTAVSPVGNEEYPQVWEMSGPIVPPVYGFKVVVLANWRKEISLAAGETTLADLCEAAWAMCDDVTYPMVPSWEVTIPMYGIKTIDDSFVFRDNLVNNIGQIDLLRSVSKIIVRTGADVRQALESVTLKRFNPSFACAPLGMYDDTKNLSYGGAVHLYRGAADNTPTENLAFSASTDKSTWTVYVPEYRNVDPATGETRPDCTSIDVRFSGIDKTYSLDFRDYSVDDSGKRFNIVRNHIYDYTINSIGAYDATVTLVAQPWNVETFDFEYTKTVGVSSRIAWTDANHYDIGSDNRVVARSAGDLTCEFTISSPVGATWYAVFEERSGDLNHFKFDDGSHMFENGLDHLTGMVDGNKVTLTIMQNHLTVGTAKLVIYARYGNVNFDTSVALGGPYLLIKD